MKFVAHCIENNIWTFLLLLYFSYLLKSLDVSIFSSLKIAVLVALNKLIQARVAWLEKIDWIKSYIKAKLNVFTEKNI